MMTLGRVSSTLILAALLKLGYWSARNTGFRMLMVGSRGSGSRAGWCETCKGHCDHLCSCSWAGGDIVDRAK